MRKKIVAGNWKMNLDFSEANDLMQDITDTLSSEKTKAGVDMIIFPPFPYLELVSDFAYGYDEEEDLDALEEPIFYYGGQNCASTKNGAYTGEVSAEMLSSMDCTHVIIGHSERRKYFNETSEELLAKVNLALDNELVPVFCCGESLEERESNKHLEVINKQLSETVFKLKESEFSNIIIAYEPVWAIGTGKTATSEQAEEMLSYIRGLIKAKYSAKCADEALLLYGGSCNEKNAKELFSCPNIDGGLIGGASLDAGKFCKIFDAALETMRK